MASKKSPLRMWNPGYSAPSIPAIKRWAASRIAADGWKTSHSNEQFMRGFHSQSPAFTNGASATCKDEIRKGVSLTDKGLARVLWEAGNVDRMVDD
jgi:hypothetical protein